MDLEIPILWNTYIHEGGHARQFNLTNNGCWCLQEHIFCVWQTGGPSLFFMIPYSTWIPFTRSVLFRRRNNMDNLELPSNDNMNVIQEDSWSLLTSKGDLYQVLGDMPLVCCGLSNIMYHHLLFHSLLRGDGWEANTTRLTLSKKLLIYSLNNACSVVTSVMLLSSFSSFSISPWGEAKMTEHTFTPLIGWLECWNKVQTQLGKINEHTLLWKLADADLEAWFLWCYTVATKICSILTHPLS